MHVVPIILNMLKTKIKILVSICAGTFVYVFISLFGGQSGFWAMKQLEEQRQNISINKAEIERLNEELTLEYVALRNDMEVIAAYARRLGFVGEGELLVKITGLPTYYTTMYNAGTVMRQAEVKFIPEWIAKLIGCIVGLLLMILLFLKDLSKSIVKLSRVQPSYEAGLRVVGYDSPSTTTYL